MAKATFWLCKVDPVRVFYEELIESDGISKATGLPVDTLMRAMHGHNFPQPVKIENQIFWIRSEVDSWVGRYREPEKKKDA